MKSVVGGHASARLVAKCDKTQDIYNSEDRLKSALSALSVNGAVCEVNKCHIFHYIRHCQAQGIKPIRLKKSVYMLRDMAQILGQEFQLATKQDIENLLCSLQERNYSEWTMSDYKVILKRFYKWLLGNNEECPKIVSWIKNKEPKNNILPEELVTEQDVLKLIENAKYVRDKAFIYLLYESGARIGEILTLRIKHVSFGDPISSILVDGKTGQRRIPIVMSSPFLHNWLVGHPLKDDPNALVWVKSNDRKGTFRRQGNRSVFRELSYSSIKKILKQTFETAQINKRYNPHAFRHSRATYLAKHLTEAQLKQFFGWTQASDMASRYVHLSGRDIDETIKRLYQL